MSQIEPTPALTPDSGDVPSAPPSAWRSILWAGVIATAWVALFALLLLGPLVQSAASGGRQEHEPVTAPAGKEVVR